jgi:HD-like signal output (HDOD) protein
LFKFFSRKKTDPKASLKRILGDYSLPSFPAAIMRTLQQIRNPNSTASSIAEVLSADPGLLVRVLRMANSAAFSPSKKVENLTQAVALVGLSQLESMVLSVGIRGVLPNPATEAFNSKQFWLTSARRGMLAHSLAARLSPTKQSECFTAAFLQDMAIPLLVDQYPKKYDAILQKWHELGGDLTVLEQEEFGWDHAEVATWLCAQWELPEYIAAQIGGHHHDEEGIYDCLPPVRLVSLVNMSSENSDLDAFRERVQAEVGIDGEVVDALIETAFGNADELYRLMS